MEFVNLDFDGLLGIKAPAHEDFRGSFQRLFESEVGGFNFPVMQASISRNPKALTFRGLHFQTPPASESKFIICISGKIQEVLVQLAKSSNYFLQSRTFLIGPEEKYQGLFVPAGFAHGYLTLSEDSNLVYFMDEPYQPLKANGIRWNDPMLGIDLIEKPRTISTQDMGWPLLEPQ